MPDAGEAATSDQAPPSWSLGCATLLAAVLIVCAVVYVFGLLRESHPPVNLTASTRGLVGLQDVTLTGNDAANRPIRWSITGWAKQLAFRGFGTAEAILPLPISDCTKMAAALDGSCTNRSVVLRTPSTITWSRADLVNAASGTETATSLEVAPTTAGYLDLFAQGSRPLAVCFNPPRQSTKLTVTRGTLVFPASVPGLQTTECGQGVAVVVQEQGAHDSGFIELGGISSATVTGHAPQAVTQGFAGSIVLNPGGTTVIGSPGQVTMRAAGNAVLTATVKMGAASQALDLSSGAADMVVTSAGELVPSEWARNSDFIAPLFGGVVTLAVAVLSGAAQELLACVRRLRPTFRQLDLWLSRRFRRHQASADALPPAAETEEGGASSTPSGS
jgi:hypothetical protein